MVIMTNPDGNEVREITFSKFDVDLNDSKDFELRMPSSSWKADMVQRCRLFVPDTEFGGIIGGKETKTTTDEIIIRGKSWRGILARKIISPPEGEAYKTVSGEINEILRELMEEQELSTLFAVPEISTDIQIQYQFERYIDLLSGIEKFLKMTNYRLDLKYVQQERGAPGLVQLQALPIKDLSQRIELSQDSQLNFSFSETKDGVNHLICLGQGELAERLTIDLYIQENGEVGATQFYFGVDEVAAVYENTNAADLETLTSEGTERLLELKNNSTFRVDAGELLLDAEINDIIGGRDYITGMYAASPVRNKIYTAENGKGKIEYSLEENEKPSSMLGGGSAGGESEIVVDYEFSETSVNPVQNRTLTKKFADLEQEIGTRFSNLQSALTEAQNVAENALFVAQQAQQAAAKALTDANAHTDQKISDLIGGAPETLDTLNEVAVALAENEDVVEALNSAIGNKVDKIDGKGLSTNDYTTSEKEKLAGIAAGANKYTHPTTSGNKHIPSGGESGQMLHWSADGTAKWGDGLSGTATSPILLTASEIDFNSLTAPGFYRNTNSSATLTNGPDITGYTTAFDLVVKRRADTSCVQEVTFFKTNMSQGTTKFYRGYSSSSGNTTGWKRIATIEDIPTNFVKSGSGAKAGLVPAPSTTAGTTKYLREDGTWTVPPNTTYSAATQSAEGLMSAADKLKTDYTNIGYGTCSTAAATAAKVITVSGNTEWELKAGSIIIVKFSVTNTAQNPTFNVNGTGAKKVWYNTALITTGNLGYAGTANRPMLFGYDDTQFIFLGWAIDANTTYSQASLGQGYGTCTTAAATAAKVVTLSGYALVINGIVAVKFTYAVPASATMNINSKGAKPIYYKGAAITAGVIGAGDIATFIYNGSQYILLTVDKFQNELDSIITNETIAAFADAGLAIT